MKAVMYHYVRPGAPSHPHFRYLHLDDFRRQLDFFQRELGVLAQEEFLDALATGSARPGVVLTFDDGLADHARHVLPELKARGLWGIFYVPTGPFQDGRVLDVHAIHLLVGRVGGIALLRAVEALVDDSLLDDAHREEFRKLTYARHDDDQSTRLVKQILNYFIAYSHRQAVIDRLVQDHLGGAPRVEDIYLSGAEMRELASAGMLIGSHSVSHRVFSRLPVDEQAREISESFAYLDRALGQNAVRTFCYPYGGFHSFTADTERLLTEAGCRFSFNVESREIAATDLKGRPQALPRFDCNQFPHGKASRAATEVAA